MSKTTRWILIGVAAGVGLAILIGVLGTRNEPSSSSETKAQATSALCSSLKSLEARSSRSTVSARAGTKGEYQSDVTTVENDWSQVQSDYQALQEAEPGDLSSAWSSFESAVKAVPDADSASDAVSSITQSADALDSAAQSTASSLSCS